MSEEKLLIEKCDEQVLLLTLNRPSAMNALDEELCAKLDAALAGAARDNSVRCIILAGAGERAFSAGYDVKELATYDADTFFRHNVQRYHYLWNMAAHPKPIIVINQGIAMGAGAIMAVSADLRIGSEESIIQFTSTPHGAAMLTWNLPQLVGWSKAKEYLMTSCKISSAEALTSGLLNRVVPVDQLRQEALNMAKMIAACEPSGPQNVKRLMREGLGKDQQSLMLNELREIQTQQLHSGNQVGEWYEDMINKK